MISGIYWTFPPLFADAEPIPAPVVAPRPLVRTASLDSGVSRANVVEFSPEMAADPSIRAHRESIALLEAGLARFRSIPGYTAEFTKQEVVSGSLGERQTMALKLRHEPFSVYMKWIDGSPGQELLYVEGQNDGEMIVRPGGLKGRFLGAIKLDPMGTLAMSESRHPVTQVGLLHLAEKILQYRYNESSWTSGYTCSEDRVKHDGRPCRRFTIVYQSPSVRKDYRKSVIWIDEELSIATKVENYGWPGEDIDPQNLDKETLLESYSYQKIDIDTQLAAIDFNAANEAYSLRRR